MSAAEDASGLLTIDELALATGVTVRTTRYYSTLGLLPPPVRRGRVAYYSDEHRARLELVRALQDHGFTLAAIERYMQRIPARASVEDLAVQRAMLTSWTSGVREVLSADELSERAGRRLFASQLEQLEVTSAVLRTEDGYVPQPSFDTGVEALDLDLPLDGVVEASEAIDRHMHALADELTDILRRRVLAPYRATQRSGDDAARFERSMGRLRQLTLQSVVSGFQRAANDVIARSLSRD